MIKVENLNVTLNKCHILHNISLEIADNEFVAIMGSSGSGKTTLLNTLGLLENFNKGDIILDGESYKSLSNRRKMKILKTRMGFLFQDFGLVHDQNIYQNIAFCVKKFGKDRYIAVKDALIKVGLEMDVHKKVYLLSGGEQQRVAIARILLKESEYILADEPTGSLDEENALKVIELFKKMQSEGKTIIIVTHDEDIASHADRIINLDELNIKK